MRGRENYERVRDLILSYIEAYGEVPTVRQVAQSGSVAVSTASLFLKQMEEEGYIAGRGSRGYVTVARDRMEATRPVAVCGAVSCGYRKLAVEEIEDYVAVPKGSLGPGEYFCLRADGNSMINAGIVNGDYVIIRKQDWADEGDIVVALVDREDATLKRYYPSPEEGYVDLVAENPDIPVQRIMLNETEPFMIQGVAVQVLHNLR